jgi:hypothetical protein
MEISTYAKAVGWSARIAGFLYFAFVGYFVVAHALAPEGLPDFRAQPLDVQLDFLALILMVVGCVLGWTRSGIAAVMIFCGYALWQLVERRLPWPPGFIEIPLVIGLLYAITWWGGTTALHRRRPAMQ